MDEIIDKITQLELIWIERDLDTAIDLLKELTAALPLTETVKADVLMLSARYTHLKNENLRGVLSNNEFLKERNFLLATTIHYTKQIRNYYGLNKIKNLSADQKNETNDSATSDISFISEMKLHYINNQSLINKYAGVEKEISNWFESKEFWDNLDRDTVIDFKNNLWHLKDIDQLLEFLNQLIKSKERANNPFARTDATFLSKEYSKYKNSITLKQTWGYLSVISNLIKHHDLEKIIPPNVYLLSNFKKHPYRKKIKIDNDDFYLIVIKPWWEHIKDKTLVDWLTGKVPIFNLFVAISIFLLFIYFAITMINVFK